MKRAIYKPRTLFSGGVIGKDLNTKYVGVPDKFKDCVIQVKHDGKTMIINDWNEAEAYRVFEDKFGRNKNYTLGYFTWQPEGK